MCSRHANSLVLSLNKKENPKIIYFLVFLLHPLTKNTIAAAMSLTVEQG